MTADEDTLLCEQLDYYKARAGEYDRWWFREGRYDRGSEANEAWFAETAELERLLQRSDPRGDLLELACGTGLWTRHLIAYADTVTAVDGASEVLAINRARVGDEHIRYLQRDLFAWTPEPAAYDACVFCFWLSHVPQGRFAAFWENVKTALRPGGRVLFIDSARAERSTATDHALADQIDHTQTRSLDDGTRFKIVKRYYEPRALERELAELGWESQVNTTGEFFVYGTATPATGRP